MDSPERALKSFSASEEFEGYCTGRRVCDGIYSTIELFLWKPVHPEVSDPDIHLSKNLFGYDIVSSIASADTLVSISVASGYR
jgi:hypothetical protein